jgi:hypothetical protein
MGWTRDDWTLLLLDTGNIRYATTDCLGSTANLVNDPRFAGLALHNATSHLWAERRCYCNQFPIPWVFQLERIE